MRQHSSSGHFERENERNSRLWARITRASISSFSAASGWARAAISSSRAAPRRSSSNFEHPNEAERGSTRGANLLGSGSQFPAHSRCRAGSIGQFERPSEAERARSRKQRRIQYFQTPIQLQSGRHGDAEQARLANLSAPTGPRGLGVGNTGTGSVSEQS